MKKKRLKVLTGALAVMVGVAACGDLLTVEDPQRYTDADLNSALQAVANGVEGAVHEVMDTYVIYQALISDVYQHTGTWNGYDEVDHGRFQYGTSAMDATMNSLLRARWFATDARERFNEQLENPGSSPLMAQIDLAEAMADFYIGTAYCEAPAVDDGPAVSDTEILQQAVTKFTTAISTAQAAGTPEYEVAALGARAMAQLYLGNYAEANADATAALAMDDGFSYDAKFNISNTNSIVTLTTATYNKAGGLRAKWWPQIVETTGPQFMLDPRTAEPDPRLPVHFEDGLATDNITPHYSQWKYYLEPDDIPLVKADGMRLIQAEYQMRQGNLTGAGSAIEIVNGIRTAAGLTALADPADAAEMQEILLDERFAEHFMEGVRAMDLYRFGITQQIFTDINDPEYDPDGRPTKFSMSDTEALYNSQIVDDLLQRCLPTT